MLQAAFCEVFSTYSFYLAKWSIGSKKNLVRNRPTHQMSAKSQFGPINDHRDIRVVHRCRKRNVVTYNGITYWWQHVLASPLKWGGQYSNCAGGPMPRCSGDIWYWYSVKLLRVTHASVSVIIGPTTIILTITGHFQGDRCAGVSRISPSCFAESMYIYLRISKGNNKGW